MTATMPTTAALEIPTGLYLHRYELTYRATAPLSLVPHPHELASVFRGALHTTTTLRFCGQPNGTGRKCQRCHCLYGKLFDPVAPPSHEHARKFHEAPVPYVIEALPTTRDYQEGSKLRFLLTLFGKANQHLPDLIRLCQQVTGYFPRHNTDHFELEEVAELPLRQGDGKNVLFSEGLLHPEFLQHKVQYGQGLSPARTDAQDLRVHFVGMTAMLSKKEPVLLPSFPLLLSRVWERAWLLNSFHGDGRYPQEAPDWERLMRRTPEALPEDWQVVYWRKKKTDRMGQSHAAGERETILGFKGKLVYEGRCRPEWLDLLRLGQYLYLGKLCAFGLGRYELLR